jgi:uncharacterized phage protein gp47/JayE
VTYVAEPYAQFVDDLLTGLTGGGVREQFVFLPENAPFRLSPPGPVVPSSVRVFGQVEAAFNNFRMDRDFVLTADSTIEWKTRADGSPAADAVWPDDGTPFYVNYDHRGPSGAVPQLNDRNPGSVTRLLAESFAREYAVLSKQLAEVYKAGFLDTATGRDLDQLVALVGLERQTRTSASGTVVFARSTPASADVFIPAGTRLSTAEPPAVVFETTEERTLHRGSLSVEVPIRALTTGATGVVAARAIAVIHRPIFGIETAYNTQATQLGGPDESDDALRGRAKRALEGAGKATTDALLAALSTLPGVRAKDVRIAEDHLKRPGVLTLNVAVPLDSATCARAVSLIEQTRPAGVRVLHNLDCAGPLGAAPAGANEMLENEIPAELTTAAGALFFPVVATAVLVPAAESMFAQARTALKRKAEDVIRAFINEAGIGELLIYNRLVADLLNVEGVLDARVELYPAGPTPLTPVRRNISPGATLRPTVDEEHGGAVHVEIGGQLVAIDVVIGITLKGAALVDTTGALLTDLTASREEARVQVTGQLADRIAGISQLSVPNLRSAIGTSESFDVTSIEFTVEYIEAGVRINKRFGEADAAIALSVLERPWIRSVKLVPTGP